MVLERTSSPSGRLWRRLPMGFTAPGTSADLLRRTDALRRSPAAGFTEFPVSAASCQLIWGPAATDALDTIAKRHIGSLVRDGELVIDHPADLLGDGLAARLLACVLHTVSQLLERADASIDELETLDPEERRRIGAFNKPLAAIDSCRTVHGVFSQQALARGQSVGFCRNKRGLVRSADEV